MYTILLTFYAWVERMYMCRNIKPLYHFDPPAGDEEIRAAAIQFVRKVSGFSKPSQANQAAFDRAVAEVAQTVQVLLAELTTTAPPRDRAVEAAKARERSRRRFGDPPAHN
jgi:hypothetical protein